MQTDPASYDIAIIGAGLAGLSAAIACEKKGYKVVLLESSAEAGGRVKTDEHEGFLLDHGFQVLLTAYEKANEVFDMGGLKLREFASGAHITDSEGSFVIADPLRDSSKLLDMAFSRVGTLKDKLKMWGLTRKLQQMSSDKVFEGKEMTTLAYLKEVGFSDKIIRHFFQPFFGGVFLERKLDTPAGMFRYVFRYFSMGSASLPANGMRALPLQLASKLKRTEIRLKTPVAGLSQEGVIALKSGDALRAKKVIVACDPKRILPQMDQGLRYRHTVTMYFSGNASLKSMRHTIGLDARKKSPINNYCRLDEVQATYAPSGKSLWCVTLREEDQSSHLQVAEALASLIRCAPSDLAHLKTYRISKALPVVNAPRNDIPAEQTQLGSHIYLAGDYLLNGSIDAALRSGARAAEAVTETLELI